MMPYQTSSVGPIVAGALGRSARLLDPPLLARKPFRQFEPSGPPAPGALTGDDEDEGPAPTPRRALLPQWPDLGESNVCIRRRCWDGPGVQHLLKVIQAVVMTARTMSCVTCAERILLSSCQGASMEVTGGGRLVVVARNLGAYRADCRGSRCAGGSQVSPPQNSQGSGA